MSKRGLGILLLVITSLLLFAWWNSNRTHTQGVTAHFALKDFNVDRVQRVELRHDDQEHVFIRDDLGTWRSRSSFNYPASTARLSELILKVHQIASTQWITANPDRYARLGLDETGKTAVVFRDAADQVLAALEFGNQRESGGGRFVKRRDQSDVYLVAEDFHIAPKPSDWLQTEFLHIPRDAVAEITMLTTEPVLTLLPDETQPGQFQISGLMENDTLKSWSVNQTASLAENLTFEEVYPLDHEQVASMEFQDAVTLRTKEGTRYNFLTAAMGEFILLQIKVEPPAVPEDEEDGEVETNTAGDLESWIYRLSFWQGAKFARSYEDFVEPPAPTEEENEEENSEFRSQNPPIA